MASVTQLGYTLEMQLVVPLGDMLRRTRLILLLLAGANLLLGFCSAVPQLLLPLAAALGPAAS